MFGVGESHYLIQVEDNNHHRRIDKPAVIFNNMSLNILRETNRHLTRDKNNVIVLLEILDPSELGYISTESRTTQPISLCFNSII